MDRLIGALGSPAPEHQNAKEQLREVEGEEANPPRRFARAERGRGGCATAADETSLGEIRNAILEAARAWKNARVEKKQGTGRHGELYRGLIRAKRQEITAPRSGLAWSLCPARARLGEGDGADARVPRRSEKGGEGSWAARWADARGQGARGLACCWASATGPGRGQWCAFFFFFPFFFFQSLF